MTSRPARTERHADLWRGDAVAALAVDGLDREVDTFPKPGLVSRIDSGSHRDMDAGTFRRSAAALRPAFAALAEAGRDGAGLGRLRVIGLAAEADMMAATGGVNTHRGAIFGLGLLCAAVGARALLPQGGRRWPDDVGSDEEIEARRRRSPHPPGRAPSPALREKETHGLGAAVARLWGRDILDGPVPLRSHGAEARRLFRAGGARAEAASGFPTLYRVGLPALAEGRRLAPGDPEAARVHACFALVAELEDTNLLHRGGAEGLAFARRAAAGFLARGGIGAPNWRATALDIHRAFVARNLSPGGSADLLAMTLFVEAAEARA